MIRISTHSIIIGNKAAILSTSKGKLKPSYISFRYDGCWSFSINEGGAPINIHCKFKLLLPRFVYIFWFGRRYIYD